MQRSGGILLLAMAASLNAAAAPLTATEQRIVAEVKAQSAGALALLETSVNINSGTMNSAGVRDVGVLYRKEFDQLGFTTRWIDMPPAMQRAGHLLATREGKQGKRLLLLGHLDTVFEADSPVQKWVRDGDRVRGQGVSDMKGGNMVIVQALRALQRAGVLDNTNITVLFTGDEENAGDPKSVSRGDMVDLAKRSDAVLSFEAQILAADGRATGTVGRRASSSFELDIKGKQGHSSGIFSQGSGYGAVYEAARVLDGFRQQVIEPGLTFNPGVILGGTDVNYDSTLSRGNAFGKTNVIANTVTIKGDLRYLDYPQRDRAHARMREIAAASLAGTSATVSFGESYPPMAVTPGNMKLLALYSQASDDAGLGKVDAVPAEARGAGDIQFAAPFVDSLDGLGVSGNGAHSPSEDLEVATLERAAIRAALMLYRMTR
ncbi:peptidase M20 [Massilia eurypsychrophila]|uniref:Peptidase M20 n=2 Tax=Massilia eurypsychrophila TaxID=1485217 RepID=A0A2G8TDS0_9BURK|nr:peptidase M20 [Massilia eurypsychrophila]